MSKLFLLKVIFFIIKPLVFFFSIIQMFLILKKVDSDVTLLNCGGYGDFRSEMASAIALKLLKKEKTIFINSSLLLKTYTLEQCN